MISKEYIDIPVVMIHEGKNIRVLRNDQAYEELCISIGRFGILEPVIVRSLGDKYDLIAGFRRLCAAKRLGFDTVPAIVIDISDCDVFDVRTQENEIRQDVERIELAIAIQAEIKKTGNSQKRIAARMGKSEGYISQTLAIMSWGDDLLTAYDNGDVSFDVAKEIHRIEDPRKRDYILCHAVKGGASAGTIRYWNSTIVVPDTIEDFEGIPVETPGGNSRFIEPKAVCNICGGAHEQKDLRVVWICPSCRDVIDSELSEK